jgi:hypothetical protein
MAEIVTKQMEEFFSDEIELIKKELEEADNLYVELKEHFDQVKQSRSPGALNFISKQTTNIISAKSNKISLLKDLVSTKKIIIDSAVKTKSDDSNANGDNAILAELHKMLLNNSKETYIEKEVPKEVHDDSYYDDLLEKRLHEIEEKKEEVVEEKEETTKNDTGNIENYTNNYKYVVDEEKNIYAVDKNYNIIDDAPIPDFIITYDENEETGELRAFNQYGEELEVILIEE